LARVESIARAAFWRMGMTFRRVAHPVI